MIYIVGLGPGNREYMLNKAISVLEKSDIIIGFKRGISSVDFIHTKKVCIKSFKELNKYLTDTSKNISIIASGDPLFFGITKYIKASFDISFEVIPGISSFQYLASKTHISWDGAYLSSLHGRNEDFISEIKNQKISIYLTDNINNPKKICEKLYKERVKCNIIIGENLSYTDEKITEGTPEKLKNNDYSNLSIMIIEKLS
ncbi:precorrin-6y C5,15-methyltransferase (decarboxylating) subunit CbiE [Clostridium sp. BJN0001]|uniref:precorrin-6y C5,15-methyltransferase (decarboxylating) subunit CbiE n=1 Tax=Clostridium sp. BJN0001 TaxID=2930219 RepID=UPI001FD391D7|nr:precorrin-6y C5,15-methyltransferase (decarboxylating) subunit CbiE [Clostridium sp. BJN0001]